MSRFKLDVIVAAIEQIPTLPKTSSDIMSAIDDKDVNIDRITELIEQDPALAVQVLKFANSPFCGTIHTVSSIKHAIVVMGLGEIKSLLLVFAVQKFFDSSVVDNDNRKRFWTHSLVCSHVANYLARYFQRPADDTIFISALIHDLGKIILDQYLHKEFLEIIDYITMEGSGFMVAEKVVVGLTHCQIAAKLLKQWCFPQKVVMQVFYHHAPWQDSEFSGNATIIYLANILTKMAGYPCLEEEEKLEPAVFVQSKSFTRLKECGFDLDGDSFQQLFDDVSALLKDDQSVKMFLG
jgi:HD-like signal output (HDOD) protein